MLRLILGRSGSGKSDFVRSEICRRVKNEQPGALLIVPEQYSHEKEREICFAAGDTASRYVEVFSFKSLAARILWTEGGLARPMLDAGGRLLTLRLGVNATVTRLRAYGPVCARPDFLEKLSRMIEEFIRYCVTPEALSETAEALPEGTCRDKLLDLSLLYGAYEALLENGPADPQSLLSFAAEKLRGSGFFAGKEIYLDGFSGFTPQERQILEAMLARAERVNICLCAPSAETPFEGPFRTMRSLERFCRENGIDVEKEYCTENKRAKTPELLKLESDFFLSSAEPWENPCGQIRIYSAKNRRSECMAVAAEIRRLCTEEGYRYREIAVMNGAEGVYDGILSGVFEAYNIPYFSDLTRKMTDQPMFRLLSTALEVVERHFETDAVISCLRCSLSGFPDRACDLLESYARTWKLPSWKWLSSEDWTGSPLGLCREVDPAQQKQLRIINKLKNRAVTPLKALAAVIGRGGTAKELCTALYTYTQQIRLPHTIARLERELKKEGREREASELTAQYTAFCNSLDQIVRAGQDTLFRAKEFSDALRLVLGCSRIGSIPDSLDSVSAGQIDRMRISSPRAVFILGVNEGLIPAAPVENGLLTEEERQTVLDAKTGILLAPSGIEAAEAQEFALYTALSAPSERLYVFVPEADDMGSALRPSYVTDRLRRLFPKAEYAVCDDTDSRTRSPGGLLELCGENLGETALLCRSILRERGKGELLRRLERFNQPDEPVGEKEKNIALYGEKMSVSASRMENYAACRFRFFAEVGLGAKEPPRAELRPAESGTFIHYVLENVARTMKGETDWADADEVYLRRLTRRFAEQFLSSPEGIPPDARTPRMDYYIQRLVNDTEQIVLRMHGEFSRSRFRPESFETDLGDDGGITLRMEDREIRLKGRVDRVDTWENNGKKYLRVVDYKSGSKEMNYTDIKAGLAVQMFLYLFVLTDRDGSVPAGVLYSKASFPKMNAERGLRDEEYAKKRDKEQCPTGLLLQDEEVLSAMEERSEGEDALFIPVSGKKEKENLVTLDEFVRLRKHIVQLLDQMTRQLRRGEVTPTPYSKADHRTACDYCPYRVVCRFDETRSGCKMNYLKKMTKEEFFKEEQDHAELDS